VFLFLAPKGGGSQIYFGCRPNFDLPFWAAPPHFRQFPSWEKKLSLGLKYQVIGPTQRLGKALVESVLTYTSGFKFSSPKKEYSVTIFFFLGGRGKIS